MSNPAIVKKNLDLCPCTLWFLYLFILIINIYLNPIAFTLDSVVSQEECDNIIKETEEKGYSPNLLNVGKGNEIFSPNYLDSYRFLSFFLHFE